MKDYIEIENIDGTKEKMEIVSTFKLEGYEYNYIIYKTLDNTHYYIAKYKGENKVDLNTDLSEEELKLANILLKSIIK